MENKTTRIEKWSQFQLPNRWKAIGIFLSIGLLITAFTVKFADIELGWFRDVLRRGILVGLLIISLSREKNEDEMIVSLRAKSYALAFIYGVAFTLFQPLLEYFIDNFIYEASPDNTFSYFDILFFMLMMQIMFFEILKRNR